HRQDVGGRLAGAGPDAARRGGGGAETARRPRGPPTWDPMHAVPAVPQGFVSVILIFLFLLPSGKDAGGSGAFGVGVAGGQSGGSLMERNLDRWTVGFAIVFVLNTIALLKIG